jgi:hypothetical protein
VRSPKLFEAPQRGAALVLCSVVSLILSASAVVLFMCFFWQCLPWAQAGEGPNQYLHPSDLWKNLKLVKRKIPKQLIIFFLIFYLDGLGPLACSHSKLI